MRFKDSEMIFLSVRNKVMKELGYINFGLLYFIVWFWFIFNREIYLK